MQCTNGARSNCLVTKQTFVTKLTKYNKQIIQNHFVFSFNHHTTNRPGSSLETFLQKLIFPYKRKSVGMDAQISLLSRGSASPLHLRNEVHTVLVQHQRRKTTRPQ